MSFSAGFFPIEDPVTFDCHSSVVAFDLEQLSAFLPPRITDIFEESRRLCHIPDSSISSWPDSGYAFLAGMSCRELCAWWYIPEEACGISASLTDSAKFHPLMKAAVIGFLIGKEPSSLCK